MASNLLADVSTARHFFVDVFFISKEKRDAEKSDNGNCYVDYNKTGTGTSDMMDGLAVVTDDDNRCVFVNTIFKKIRNIL